MYDNNLMSKINNEIFMLKLSIDAFKKAHQSKLEDKDIEILQKKASGLYKDFSLNATKGIPLTTAKRDAFFHILNDMKKILKSIKPDDTLMKYEIADMEKTMDNIIFLLRKIKTKNKRITKKH